MKRLLGVQTEAVTATENKSEQSPSPTKHANNTAYLTASPVIMLLH